MISAVENHFGPGRSYATGVSHYGSATASGIGSNNNLIAAPCPIIGLPQPMSATEFARPLPKPNRYNGGQSLRNGLSTPSTGRKYSIDQSSPVNLAVSQSMSDNGTTTNGLSMSHKHNNVASLTAAAKPSSLESEQDAISNSIASLYQHKLGYGPPDTATPLYYPNFYGRPHTSSVYAAHSLYAPPPHTSHPMSNGRHHGVAYPHVETYSTPYTMFGPNAYSPPAPTRPGLSPHSPIGTITVGTASQQSTNSSISAQSVLPANASQLSVSPPSLYAQQRESQYHMKPASQHDHSSSSIVKSLNAYRTDSKDRESKIAHHLNGKSNDFKIPSGKEGSLKHRILTRPDMTTKPSQKSSSSSSSSTSSMNSQHSSDSKSSSRLASQNGSNGTNNNNNNANSKNKNLSCNGTSNFSRGSLIELSTGELKRVEDMRIEDFTISSSKNPNLQLIDTTVHKIMPKSKNSVVITLSYNNKNQISLETQPIHPFFVYGKGWASYSPETTFNELGLKCHLLEVGDICISLTPRDQSSKQQQQQKSTMESTPENLSRKKQQQQIQQHHQSSHTNPPKSIPNRPYTSFESIYNSHLRHPMLNQESSISRKYSAMAPPLPPTSSAADVMELMSHARDGEAIDATMHSRKCRAWSTPEICDVKKIN